MKTIKEFIVDEVKVRCGHIFKFDKPTTLIDKQEVLELIDEISEVPCSDLERLKARIEGEEEGK